MSGTTSRTDVPKDSGMFQGKVVSWNLEDFDKWWMTFFFWKGKRRPKKLGNSSNRLFFSYIEKWVIKKYNQENCNKYQ